MCVFVFVCVCVCVCVCVFHYACMIVFINAFCLFIYRLLTCMWVFARYMFFFNHFVKRFLSLKALYKFPVNSICRAGSNVA